METDQVADVLAQIKIQKAMGSDPYCLQIRDLHGDDPRDCCSLRVRSHRSIPSTSRVFAASCDHPAADSREEVGPGNRESAGRSTGADAPKDSKGHTTPLMILVSTTAAHRSFSMVMAATQAVVGRPALCLRR